MMAAERPTFQASSEQGFVCTHQLPFSKFPSDKA